MWFNHTPSDLSFAQTAKTHIQFAFPVKASCHRLFEILSPAKTKPNGQKSMCGRIGPPPAA